VDLDVTVTAMVGFFVSCYCVLFSVSDLVYPQTPIWATTTLLQTSDGRLPRNEHNAGLVAATALGWRVLDRHGMTRALHRDMLKYRMNFGRVYVDNVHFNPFVTDEFNNVLLNMLC
jgi:hypothetical protein